MENEIAKQLCEKFKELCQKNGIKKGSKKYLDYEVVFFQGAINLMLIQNPEYVLTPLIYFSMISSRSICEEIELHFKNQTQEK